MQKLVHVGVAITGKHVIRNVENKDTIRLEETLDKLWDRYEPVHVFLRRNLHIIPHVRIGRRSQNKIYKFSLYSSHKLSAILMVDLIEHYAFLKTEHYASTFFQNYFVR